jgi:hypothetical protein
VKGVSYRWVNRRNVNLNVCLKISGRKRFIEGPVGKWPMLATPWDLYLFLGNYKSPDVPRRWVLNTAPYETEWRGQRYFDDVKAGRKFVRELIKRADAIARLDGTNEPGPIIHELLVKEGFSVDVAT